MDTPTNGAASGPGRDDLDLRRHLHRLPASAGGRPNVFEYVAASEADLEAARSDDLARAADHGGALEAYNLRPESAEAVALAPRSRPTDRTALYGPARTVHSPVLRPHKGACDRGRERPRARCGVRVHRGSARTSPSGRSRHPAREWTVDGIVHGR